MAPNAGSSKYELKTGNKFQPLHWEHKTNEQGQDDTTGA